MGDVKGRCVGDVEGRHVGLRFKKESNLKEEQKKVMERRRKEVRVVPMLVRKKVPVRAAPIVGMRNQNTASVCLRVVLLWGARRMRSGEHSKVSQKIVCPLQVCIRHCLAFGPLFSPYQFCSYPSPYGDDEYDHQY